MRLQGAGLYRVILHRGSNGFEAFDTGEHSIFLFADQRAAAAAVANFPNDQTEKLTATKISIV